MVDTTTVKEMANFIWSVADLLRGDYKQADYGKVILPFTVLRRLDCVLEPTKQIVLNFIEELKGKGIEPNDKVLKVKTGLGLHNLSSYNFNRLKADPDNIADNLKNYINGFTSSGREIMEHFKIFNHIEILEDAGLLFQIVQKFGEVDLHPNRVANDMMGYVFEELIRKFAELSNETAGEHFTPREVIRLMVNVLFHNGKKVLTTRGVIRNIYDPACGTGGMLAIAEDYMKELNPQADPNVYGQELNPESYAICKSDMLIKAQTVENIVLGNSFTNDGHEGKTFDFMLSNPPFGVEWKKVEKEIKNEYEKLGESGRFGAGLPRISDGSLLFLQHMISKMENDDDGSRIAIVFNGSPLFSGGAGSGESNIRRWIIEQDLLEAIIALPDQLFYNTGIFTYIWVLNNRKENKRKGKIQLVNGISFYKKMSRSLGNKRHELTPEHIDEITRIYGDFTEDEEGELCKIFDNIEFGYSRITVERPLRLNFQVSPERIEVVREESAFKGLVKSKKKGEAVDMDIEEGLKSQEKIIQVLKNMDSSILYKNRDRFKDALNSVFDQMGIKISSSVKKAIIKGLSERDDSADEALDKYGNPVPDPQLRDYEKVPLKESIEEYFDREVKAHVPDAWIDEKKTVIGYEFNFTKYFYKYKPLRPLKEVKADIIALEKESGGMLTEVLDL